jgi:hypothetical protein
MNTAPLAITVDLPTTMQLLHGKSRVISLGDSFSVSGVHDTSSTSASVHNLDPHRDQFTADGALIY